MKGVLRARARPDATCRKGAASLRSLTCIRHLSNAECGWCCAVFAAIIVKIVHSSLKMNVNVYKLMKMNNCERFLIGECGNILDRASRSRES